MVFGQLENTWLITIRKSVYCIVVQYLANKFKYQIIWWEWQNHLFKGQLNFTDLWPKRKKKSNKKHFANGIVSAGMLTAFPEVCFPSACPPRSLTLQEAQCPSFTCFQLAHLKSKHMQCFSLRSSANPNDQSWKRPSQRQHESYFGWCPQVRVRCQTPLVPAPALLEGRYSSSHQSTASQPSSTALLLVIISC